MNSKIRLNEKMQFVGTGGSGHSILFDAKEESGGKDSAVRPIETMVMSVGACSGMDVVSILRKMKQKIINFEVRLNYNRKNEHPKPIDRLKLKYKVWGDIQERKLEKAINLSLDKYCGAINSLKKEIEVDYEYEIIGQIDDK